MKAITIKQPWATLIALGEKKFETRSWQTKYRGPLAIHAGKSVDVGAFDEVAILSTLCRYGIRSYKDLPTGVVIATGKLVECHKVHIDYYPLYDEEKAGTENGLLIEGDEYWFGDYAEGRYAWELANVEVLAEPIPAKGQLSLWEWSHDPLHMPRL
ncbi:ASCH domain-containing protein [Heyndrickxia sporothermodurans]